MPGVKILEPVRNYERHSEWPTGSHLEIAVINNPVHFLLDEFFFQIVLLLSVLVEDLRPCVFAVGNLVPIRLRGAYLRCHCKFHLPGRWHPNPHRGNVRLVVVIQVQEMWLSAQDTAPRGPIWGYPTSWVSAGTLCCRESAGVLSRDFSVGLGSSRSWTCKWPPLPVQGQVPSNLCGRVSPPWIDLWV